MYRTTPCMAARRSSACSTLEFETIFDINDKLKQNGLNATAILIGGNQKKPWSAVEFGTIFTVDDKLTVTSDPNSAQFEFNGSTLEIQGADKLVERKREVSVVSGTGKFRLARGFAVIETSSIDVANANAILKITFNVFYN
ncbi:hypothetical protein Dsin_031668 [Dipteronia sinensis]|uniref:Dirigent protein n=1 Tax=Dipteronia sinensis TaxID=43782 RepID=A0AAE0DSM1_9ROSI|nr:hypothetical protein Dsin_031668 [Dipteronia sinensis]